MAFGAKQLPMAIDTIGWFSTLSVQATEDLKLTRREIPPTVKVFFGGRILDRMTTVPSLSMGNLNLEHVDFLVQPPQEEGADTQTVAGTLAPNLLKGFDIDFDFANKKVNFFTQDHCPGQVVYWTTSGAARVPFKLDPSLHITFPMTLDGHTLDAMLATDDPVTHINEADAYQYFGLAENSADVDHVPTVKSDGSKTTVPGHRFASLSVGGVAITHPMIYFHPDDVGRAVRNEFQRDNPQTMANLHQPPLVLGAHELKFLHLYIAYQERMLYVTAADAH
jgi:hypothetical protein